jgi:hypothetical protein
MKREKSREAPMDRMAGMAVFTKVISQLLGSGAGA